MGLTGVEAGGGTVMRGASVLFCPACICLLFYVSQCMSFLPVCTGIHIILVVVVTVGLMAAFIPPVL